MLWRAVKRRFVVYINTSLLLLVAVYLILRYDDISHATTASWGISSYSIDSLTKDAKPSKTIASPHSRPTYDGRETPKYILSHATTKPTSSSSTVIHRHSTVGTSVSPAITSEPENLKHGAKVHKLLPSILDPEDTSIDRMICPPINTTRYAHLQAGESKSIGRKYFIALNLRQCVDLLPRLMGSILEVIRFLGPERCALSIVEGNSDDGTLETLQLLKKELAKMGVMYYLKRSAVNPNDGKRIEKLALLRALALQPVTGEVIDEKMYEPARPIDEDEDDEGESPAERNGQPLPDGADLRRARTVRKVAATKTVGAGITPANTVLPLSTDASILFLNDVAACAEDALELLHQRKIQDADMTCGMDWHHPGGGPPLFYDVWVARALNGDLFFNIAGDGSWDHPDEMFPNEPVARARLAAGRPFQVFACWNGGVAVAAAPLVEREVGFRSSREGECFQGEPQLFCKDMWMRGRGRIAVVPSVNFQYTDELGRRVKKEKGYVSDWLAKDANQDIPEKVRWQKEPPPMVKCMPEFHRQDWLPWNESLAW